jgi:hypothetical protein
MIYSHSSLMYQAELLTRCRLIYYSTVVGFSWSCFLCIRLVVAVRAAARARRGRCRPRAGERRARGWRRAMAFAPGESGRYCLALARAGAPARARGGREGGEREARHWRGESAGESDVARSDWSTCRDLIGPRVLAVATSRF